MYVHMPTLIAARPGVLRRRGPGQLPDHHQFAELPGRDRLDDRAADQLTGCPSAVVPRTLGVLLA